MADASAFVGCAQTLTFTVATLQASAPTVKFPGGAVSERVQQAGAGMGAPLIQVGGIFLKDDSFFQFTTVTAAPDSCAVTALHAITGAVQGAHTSGCSKFHMSRTSGSATNFSCKQRKKHSAAKPKPRTQEGILCPYADCSPWSGGDRRGHLH